MSTFVLILLVNNALVTISGFTSLDACEQEGAAFDKPLWGHMHHCVEVR